MIKSCKLCKTGYSTDEKKRKYCSLKCAYADRGGKVKSRCENCGKMFIARRCRLAKGFDKYCGQACMAQAMVTSIEKQCEYCGEPFSVPPSRMGFSRFCSDKCRDTARRTRVERHCEICGKLMFAELGKLAKGWDRFCSRRCQNIGNSGENCYNWKGGITPENAAIRASREYKEWRNAVLVRDSCTCQDCGSTENSHAHHIFPFFDFPEHRFEIWNGVTLCKPCHLKTHFGVKTNMETA